MKLFPKGESFNCFTLKNMAAEIWDAEPEPEQKFHQVRQR